MAESDTTTGAAVDPEDIRMEKLGPNSGSRKNRKRVGRGEGSGHGKTSGRGTKGLGARSGGGVRPGFTGGQMPLYMQQGKLRGPNKKMSMPMGPFRTHTVPVNVGSLAVFPAGSVVDEAALVEKGLVKNNSNRGWPIKILGDGEIGVALTVRADAFSSSAQAKIEAAGGTVEVLSPPSAPAAPEPVDEAPIAEGPPSEESPSEDPPLDEPGAEESVVEEPASHEGADRAASEEQTEESASDDGGDEAS